MKTNKKSNIIILVAVFAMFLLLQNGCVKDKPIIIEEKPLEIGQIMTSEEASKLTDGSLLHIPEYDDKKTNRKAYLSPTGRLYYIDDFSFGKIPEGKTDYKITWGFQGYQKFYSWFTDRRTITGITKITPETDETKVRYKLFIQWDDYGDDPKTFTNKCFASAYFDDLPFTFTLQINKEDCDLEISDVSHIQYTVTTNKNEKFKYESPLNESAKTDIFMYSYSDYLDGEPVVYFITSKFVYNDGKVSSLETAWVEISFDSQQNVFYFDVWK